MTVPTLTPAPGSTGAPTSGAGRVGDDFAHLHVASSFSMRYGACPPEELVARAAGLGLSTLALTDRDGAYGAVRFVQACQRAGIDPVLGVDLALQAPPPPGWPTRPPVKGGPLVADHHPRVTVLARGQHAGLPAGTGWSRLCRLITGTHLAGERGEPRTSPELLATAAQPVDGVAPVVVLLGPDSDVGRALRERRTEAAERLLEQWRRRLPGAVAVEVVCHGGPAGTPGSLGHAARLWGLARRCGVPAVLTAAVRHGEPGQARVVDVLDAARRMVPLEERHLDRVSTAGHLADAGTMATLAGRVAEATGPGARAADLLGATARLARECVQLPGPDLGIGQVHLPEPEVLGVRGLTEAQQVLTERCRAAVPRRYPDAGGAALERVHRRLAEELDVVATLGYPTYFLTVAQVVDLIREMDVRVAARGSGAGSLVNYLLGISGVDPIEHDLLMERFCTPLRAQLPDIDVDVESARRTEIYERILQRFGSERVTCVSMMETYRVRHAVRDVAATLGMPPAEVDAVAKAFPHIRARDARQAVRDLPELRRHGLDTPRMQQLLELVEGLDGLPRHVAMHPCGVLLSDARLLDRTPVEASWLGFPMSQFDKDDVEELGLLKLDVLGVRMQSAMAHAVTEVERVDGQRIDLDDSRQVPLDDPLTYSLIQSTRTLGCFQIESPGQRELIGKFAPETFEDIIIDISLFRPGPVKSDMVRPFLQARQGWSDPELLHPTLAPYLRSTCGVVVFHEQVLQLVARTAGVSLAQADEVRRAMGSPEGQEEVERWWRPAAAAGGYTPEEVDRIWQVLAAFASFGFCKAHAAAFALPTVQSAWLKAHHTAAFLAGVLTHDPGMYPKRLILDEARTMGVHVLGLDVNASDRVYRVEPVPAPDRDPDDGGPGSGGAGAVDPWRAGTTGSAGRAAGAGLGDLVEADLAAVEARAGRYGVRVSLADVKGISEAELDRVVAGQPYHSLADFWQRARVSRPVAERMVLAGAFDRLHRVGEHAVGRGGPTRRDLLLHVAELDRWSRSHRPPGRGRGRGPGPSPVPPALTSAGPRRSDPAPAHDVAARTQAQAQGARRWHQRQVDPTQLALDLGDAPAVATGSGLPEMTPQERVRAELEVLGLDVSGHVTTTYRPLLQALGVVPAAGLLGARNRAQVLVAGAKVATQTPPVRSGRRVVFLTLDDGTGPSDAAFFEEAQAAFAGTVFDSWLLLVRGVLRRTGPRGVSLTADAAWELSRLQQVFDTAGLEAVRSVMAEQEQHARAVATEAEQAARAARAQQGQPEGRRVLVHASGFRQSPYADIAPVEPTTKLWHASPGSAGW